MRRTSRIPASYIVARCALNSTKLQRVDVSLFLVIPGQLEDFMDPELVASIDGGFANAGGTLWRWADARTARKTWTWKDANDGLLELSRKWRLRGIKANLWAT
jgi:hypothetical protein